MELSKKLFCVFSLVLLASCNEQVAPELKNSGVTDGAATGDTVVPEEYYIKLTNKSSKLLNYQLHRTGPGNFNSTAKEPGECKISSTAPFLNGLYAGEANATGPVIEHDDKVYDISCFYEMEELALYANGFEFELSASPNTCEYIAYAPFSFYDRIPGNSTTSVTKVECGDVPDAAAAKAAAVTFSAALVTNSAGSDSVGCGESLDTGFALGAPNSASVEFTSVDDGDLCRFDYSGETDENLEPGQNCDIGTINITTLTVSYSLDDGYTVARTDTIKKCGGKISNCIQGPITQASELSGMTSGRVLYTPEEDEVFEQAFEMKDMISTNRRYGSYQYANFRAPLANPNIDFETYTDDTLAGVWTDVLDAERKRFDPDVMEYYAANRQYKDTTQVVDTLTVGGAWDDATTVNGYTARPYASDPFMGLSGYRTNPFYSFYCLDSAFDVKARIRMVVRDWDRTLTKNASLELISDYRGDDPGTNTLSRMDNPVDQEVLGSPDANNNFNDRGDFDNLIPMTRTAGLLQIGGGTPTLWAPESGFFNTAIFTNGAF